MKINVDFSDLERIRRSIGAEKASVGELSRKRSSTANPYEIELLKRGEITLSGEVLLEQLSEIGGLLAIGSTQITLHIEEPNEDFETLSAVPAQNPKFHVSDCKMLDTMRGAGRFNRYVSSNKEDGYFTVLPLLDIYSRKRGKKMRSKLMPCRYCLTKINYYGYRSASPIERTSIVEKLELKLFFDEFKTTFRTLPLYNEECYPAGGYPKDWGEISNFVRSQNNWCCSCCKTDFTRHRNMLHTHHIDGVGGNVKPSNLMAICLACHSKQPKHAHMRVLSSEKALIESIRRTQDNPLKCPNCNG